MIEKFVVGLIGAPFGVNGFVKIHSCSGEIDHLLKLQSVTVTKDGKERTLQIEESSPSPLAMRFAGINTPEAAKALTGAQLLASREQAAPLAKGEYYVEDLKGLTVITEGGETIGTITDIIEGGNGELAEILTQKGIGAHEKEKKLVPFNKEFFPEVSPEKGKVMMKNLWILE